MPGEYLDLRKEYNTKYRRGKNFSRRNYRSRSTVLQKDMTAQKIHLYRRPITSQIGTPVYDLAKMR